MISPFATVSLQPNPPAAQHSRANALSLAELLGALSHALDLTEGQPVGHCKRACWIGTQIGMRLKAEQLRVLLAMLGLGGYALGFTAPEMRRGLQFVIYGMILIYESILKLTGLAARGGVSGLRVMQERYVARRDARAEAEDDGEDHVHVGSRRRQHGAVVDPGADHHADARAVEHQPQRDADRDGDGQRELHVQQSRHTGHEGHRHEPRRHDQRRGDDR